MAIVAAVSLASGKPFVIVRKGAKGYGTDKAMEGRAEAGQRVIMIEDMVTSGGAALMAVDKLREAGLTSNPALRGRSRRGRPRAIEAKGLTFRSTVHGHVAGHQEGLTRRSPTVNEGIAAWSSVAAAWPSSSATRLPRESHSYSPEKRKYETAVTSTCPPPVYV